MDEPQSCRAHRGRDPQRAANNARGWDEEDVLLLRVYSDRWRSGYILVLVQLVDW